MVASISLERSTSFRWSAATACRDAARIGVEIERALRLEVHSIGTCVSACVRRAEENVGWAWTWRVVRVLAKVALWREGG